MEPHIAHIKAALDAKMKITPKGKPYWYGRDIMEILGYARWEDFRNVVEKAKVACENAGHFSSHHLRYMPEMIEAGKGAKKKRENVVLSKYVCYLTAMNGDESKPEIAAVQTYFAEQTHQQEMVESLTDEQRRLYLRNRVKSGNRALMKTAQLAGVENFAKFNDAGIRGLYGDRGVQDLKALKGIAAPDDFLDCIDREELAANEFRITQTNAKIQRDKISGEYNCTTTHHQIGKTVRGAIESMGGTMPEKLPAAPSIKPLADKQAKHTKEITAEVIPDSV